MIGILWEWKVFCVDSFEDPSRDRERMDTWWSDQRRLNGTIFRVWLRRGKPGDGRVGECDCWCFNKHPWLFVTNLGVCILNWVLIHNLMMCLVRVVGRPRFGLNTGRLKQLPTGWRDFVMVLASCWIAEEHTIMCGCFDESDNKDLLWHSNHSIPIKRLWRWMMRAHKRQSGDFGHASFLKRGSGIHVNGFYEACEVYVWKMISSFGDLSDSRFGKWREEVVNPSTRRSMVFHEKIIVDLCSNNIRSE